MTCLRASSALISEPPSSVVVSSREIFTEVLGSKFASPSYKAARTLDEPMSRAKMSGVSNADFYDSE